MTRTPEPRVPENTGAVEQAFSRGDKQGREDVNGLSQQPFGESAPIYPFVPREKTQVALKSEKTSIWLIAAP